MKIITITSQVFLLILISPLVSGVIRKIKNNLRMRKGPGIFQPYYNLFKLFGKEEVVSERASWIFGAAPYVVLSSTVAALFLVPVYAAGVSADGTGDFLAVVFLLALGRFFIALSALDTGSSFGGMGSSREMFISSVVEPVIVLSAFAVGVLHCSTNFTAVNMPDTMFLCRAAAALALFFAAIAETSRLPVDNQETHLELTMVHEAMLLEYSGRPLALMELAAHIKQILFFLIVCNILVPAGYFSGSMATGIAAAIVKVAAICAVVSVLDVSVAKLRLFRVVDFLGIGLLFAVLSFIFALMRI